VAFNAGRLMYVALYLQYFRTRISGQPVLL
jgi:hypothetical protein